MRIIIFLFAVIVIAGPATGAAEPDEGVAPGWARESLPDRLMPYVGRRGLPEPWSSRPKPLGSGVAGLDRWQANHFIVYRPETAAFLYGSYTPRRVRAERGRLPGFERVVAQYAAVDATDVQKATALLKAMPAVLRHPTIPPFGKPVRADRNLDDESLLRSGCGFCNEQARVFVRLCQAAGIPARMIFMFYADKRTGHVVAEFYTDGRWSMADTSWYCVFPDPNGKLLSAAELHDRADARPLTDKVYRARFQEIIRLGDTDLGAEPAKLRTSLADKKPDQFGCFGVLNYPLPK